MRVGILLQITGDDGAIRPAEKVATFEKATERPKDLGVSIAEGKAMLAAVQARTVLAKAQPGRGSGGAARPAVSAGAARAAIRSCSARCMAMSS